MCGSSNCNCGCPNANVFQEEICGNLTGILTNYVAWEVPVNGGENDYIQGTFQIFHVVL